MYKLDIIKIGKLALRVNLMSVKANGREPKSCSCQVFHFKLGSFVVT